MSDNFLGFVAILAPFMMVITIVWMAQRNKLEEKKLESTASASAQKAAEYALQIQRLEDRVQVLERIVTDRGYNVAAQIEALRDVKSVENQLGLESDTAASGVPLGLDKKEQA